MKRRRSYLISILLAVVPLVVILAVNEGLYRYAGIGRKSALLWRVEPEPSTPTKHLKETSGLAGSGYAPRWVGSSSRPLNLYFFGSSMTMYDVQPSFAGPLRDLHIRVYNLGRPAFPIDRYYDAILMTAGEAPVDLVVIEYSLVTTSDEHLVFRTETFGAGLAWSGVVFDQKLRSLRHTIEWLGGAQREGEQSPAVPSPTVYQRERRTMAAFLEAVRKEPSKSRGALTRSFQPSTERWERLMGYPDLAKKDRVWVRTQYLAIASLSRILDLCREKQIGLVVFIPPRALDLRDNVGGKAPLQHAMAEYSLRALQLWARQNHVPLLNYDAWSKDEKNFYDSLHLRVDGAALFSRQLFLALAELFQRLSAKSDGSSPLSLPMKESGAGRT